MLCLDQLSGELQHFRRLEQQRTEEGADVDEDSGGGSEKDGSTEPAVPAGSVDRGGFEMGG